MKHKILYFLLPVLSVISMMMTSCKKEETASGEKKMVSFYITPNSTVAEIADSAEIAVVASFSDGTMTDLTAVAEITSSDPTIAKVEKGKGKVVGLKEGKVTLTARYGDNVDTCTFVSSEITGVVITVYSDEYAVGVYPTEVVGTADVARIAVFKSGDTKALEIGPEDLKSNDESIVVVKTAEKDGKKVFDGLAVQKKDGVWGKLTTSYETKAGGAVDGVIYLCVGKYVTGDIYLETSERDTIPSLLVDPSAQIVVKELDNDSTIVIERKGTDTLALGASSGIVARAVFSWQEWWPDSKLDTIDILGFVKEKVESSNAQCLSIVEGVTAVGIGEKDGMNISAAVFDTILLRNVAVKQTQEVDYYEVNVTEDYLYAGGVLHYSYYQVLEDGSKVDLTNTGNKDIQSAAAFADGSLSKVSMGTGTINLYSVKYQKEDSLRVVVYHNGADTTHSKFIPYYNIPDKASVTKDGLFFESTGGKFTHKDFTVVDDTEKEYSASLKDGKIFVKKADLVSGREYTVYYGPGSKYYSYFVEFE